MARINRPSDRLSTKLQLLAEKEYTELRNAHDPAQVAAIHAKFQPEYQRLGQLMMQRNQKFQLLAMKHRQEMQTIMNGLQNAMAPLEKQVGVVVGQITKALH